jgi:hypothetical protein
MRAVSFVSARRMHRLGTVDPPPRFRSRAAEIRYLMSQPLDRPLRWPPRVNPKGPITTASVKFDKISRCALCAKNCDPRTRSQEPAGDWVKLFGGPR